MDGASAPIFVVAGGHDQGAMYLLDGTPNNAAVWVGRARNKFYPLPEPNAFYTGDQDKVEFIGSLRDYDAWTWGDALFITLDPYWHSKQPVDSMLVEGGKGSPATAASAATGRSVSTDMWEVTHGEAQYRWLKKTLEESKAKYKFAFAHHVFQGHDHIFVRQQKDGVVYQETPNPANPFYEKTTDRFRSAYKSGDYRPPSGHLRVTVGPSITKVDYIRSWMPQDETPEHQQGEVAFSYTVKPGK